MELVPSLHMTSNSISVIIPAFNAEKTIRRALRSVENDGSPARDVNTSAAGLAESHPSDFQAPDHRDRRLFGPERRPCCANRVDRSAANDQHGAEGPRWRDHPTDLETSCVNIAEPRTRGYCG